MFRDKNVSSGYPYLLEAIMIATLRSLSPPLHGNRWHDIECHKILEELEVDTGIPNIDWAKLNVAWPIVQRFGIKRAPSRTKLAEA